MTVSAELVENKIFLFGVNTENLEAAMVRPVLSEIVLNEQIYYVISYLPKRRSEFRLLFLLLMLIETFSSDKSLRGIPGLEEILNCDTFRK